MAVMMQTITVAHLLMLQAAICKGMPKRILRLDINTDLATEGLVPNCPLDLSMRSVLGNLLGNTYVWHQQAQHNKARKRPCPDASRYNKIAVSFTRPDVQDSFSIQVMKKS